VRDATLFGALVIRFAQRLRRRFATALAVVAALAFVADGALGSEHHVPVAAGGHYHAHAHSHSHGPADAADHQFVDGDAVDAHSPGSSPPTGADVGTSCCSCACSAAIVLPSLSAQATPFMLIRNMTFAHRRHGDGIVPEGLRRPPRPLSIA
jgi:hypothetical protein